ncbi:MAG: homoserine kinase [Desulfovermiculus sp.]|nr:homoserine kinase [Desulfovermiculus sp.]
MTARTTGPVFEETRNWAWNSVNGLCLIFIGMPGAGKSTLASALARRIGWACLDTDHLMEAWYGLPLETLGQTLGREGFLLAEEKTLLSLDVNRCVIATGGSVVYSPRAMQALKRNGVIIYLQADYPTIAQRVDQHPERGLIMQSGQSLHDIYLERQTLYERYAELVVSTASASIQDCIQNLEASIYEFWSPKKQEK